MKAETVKKLRERLELTQAELADEIGYTQPTVCRWETGELIIPARAAKLLGYLQAAKLK